MLRVFTTGKVTAFLALCRTILRMRPRLCEGDAKLSAVVYAKPLQELLQNASFFFGNDAKQAFQVLKSRFTKAPTLSHYQPGIQCVIETDASGFAVAAVL